MAQIRFRRRDLLDCVQPHTAAARSIDDFGILALFFSKAYNERVKKVVISSVAITFLLLTATAIAVLYASGYRLSQQNGKTFVEGTGVIVLTSAPDGARVFVNDHLTTATNNTINLQPGEYDVRIEKEGYFSWKKKIVVKEGEVSQANALLFPSTPKLDPLTTTGAENVTVDSTNTLLTYTTRGSTLRKNGIYLVDMNSRPILPIGGLATQLADTTGADFSQAGLEFSPDSDQLIASISAQTGTSLYLLSTKGFNDTPQDVTNTIFSVRSDWQQLQEEKEQRQIRNLNRKLRPLVTTNFSNRIFSPDNEKILYTASQSAQLPIVIKPRLKGTNSTPEDRKIQAGNTYVYDIKEDRNYLIHTTDAEHKVPKYIWHPDSSHLIYTQDGKINAMEFDGQNLTTLYAGPFSDNFVTVWPDGSNIVILTNLNVPGTPLNLYKLSLK